MFMLPREVKWTPHFIRVFAYSRKLRQFTEVVPGVLIHVVSSHMHTDHRREVELTKISNSFLHTDELV